MAVKNCLQQHFSQRTRVFFYMTAEQKNKSGQRVKTSSSAFTYCPRARLSMPAHIFLPFQSDVQSSCLGGNAIRRHTKGLLLGLKPTTKLIRKPYKNTQKYRSGTLFVNFLLCIFFYYYVSDMQFNHSSKRVPPCSTTTFSASGFNFFFFFQF